MSELYQFQRIDETNNLVECWFTHKALDEIKLMDLSDKIVWMFGAGMGDSWLAKRSKKLYVVERKEEWLTKSIEACRINNIDNIEYLYRPCNDSSGMDKYYLEIIDDNVDVIISDDAYRTEAVDIAIKYFKSKNKEGILICDNYWQDMVWKSPIALEWLEPFDKHIHSQPDHTDFEEKGCEWKTAIIFIK